MTMLTLPPPGLSLVEASAGTGKTHALTTLFVRLVVEAELNVRDILVVTFTIAATAELRQRIRNRLVSAHAAFSGQAGMDAELDAYAAATPAEGCSAAARRLRSATAGFDEAAIFTIHAFCQRTLRELAFDSLQRSDAELLSDTTLLLQEVVADYWVQHLHGDPALVSAVSAGKLKRDHLEDLVANVLAQPSAVVRPTAAELVQLDEPQATLRRFEIDGINYARRELDVRKRLANVMSFDDLLLRLDAALQGAGGAALGEKLRRRYPAALVDEFQDTDPVQYRILSQIYAPSPQADSRLILVGDPKQAIYSFRGADIFTYMEARRRVSSLPERLLVNRRSSPHLVAAVNLMFSPQRVPDPFIFRDIEFQPSQPPEQPVAALGGSQAGKPPLRFLLAKRHDMAVRGSLANKGPAAEYVVAAVARDIAAWLRQGVQIDNRAVEASDFAVLCRTNEQVHRLQRALRRYGIPSVLRGDASVFTTPEAIELERVLTAMAEPTDSRALRAAMATSLLGVGAAELYGFSTDEVGWERWAARFRALHERWTSRGFMSAFRALLHDTELAAQQLGRAGGERCMTNLLHLAELLQRAAGEQRLGPLALVEWLRRMRLDDETSGGMAPEAMQIRLESDEAAVQLLTIHVSKGLEFNLVYCPFLWTPGGNSRKVAMFHDPTAGDVATIDLNQPQRDVAKQQARRETFAENMRLVYVALTRARLACSVVWGALRGIEDSALGYLLHPAGGGSLDALKEHIKTLDESAIESDLQALAHASNGAIVVEHLPPPAVVSHETVPLNPTQEGKRDLQLCVVQRDVAGAWRTSSFSALVGSAHGAYTPQSDGVDRDEAPDTDDVAEAPGEPLAHLSLDTFPSGARAGRLLHRVFEEIDFAGVRTAELNELLLRLLPLYGYETAWSAALAAAVEAALETPLDDGRPPLQLRRIGSSQRAVEMEFIFPVAHAIERPAVAALTRERLANVFAEHAATPWLRDYAEEIRALGFQPLNGYLRGFIDLIFEHAGRWYVVDYKSNRLGPRPRDYAADRLVGEMCRAHYVLQYHLYCVALHRYLQQRLPRYDYEKHFGGAYYLFLRGMKPLQAPGTGVFADRPPRLLIEALSELMSDPGATP